MSVTENWNFDYEEAKKRLPPFLRQLFPDGIFELGEKNNELPSYTIKTQPRLGEGYYSTAVVFFRGRIDELSENKTSDLTYYMYNAEKSSSIIPNRDWFNFTSGVLQDAKRIGLVTSDSETISPITVLTFYFSCKKILTGSLRDDLNIRFYPGSNQLLLLESHVTFMGKSIPEVIQKEIRHFMKTTEDGKEREPFMECISLGAAEFLPFRNNFYVVDCKNTTNTSIPSYTVRHTHIIRWNYKKQL